MLTITVAQDGSGDFASIAEAVLAVPYEEEALVQVGPGLYREKLICEKRCITLRGAGADRTRLVWGDGGKLPHKDGRPTHTFRSYTAFFSGGTLCVEDMTIENDAGPGAQAGQAVAAYVDSARAVFRRVKLLGNQDTLFCAPLPEKEREKDGFLGPRGLAPRRPTAQYYTECEIAGDIDFIFGGGDALFENCTLRTVDNHIPHSYVTAPSGKADGLGFVFWNCDFVSDCPAGSVYLGRPWRPEGKTAVLDCRLGAHIAPEGFIAWNDRTDTGLATFAEADSAGPGAAERLRQQRKPQCMRQRPGHPFRHVVAAPTAAGRHRDDAVIPDRSARHRAGHRLGKVHLDLCAEQPGCHLYAQLHRRPALPFVFGAEDSVPDDALIPVGRGGPFQPAQIVAGPGQPHSRAAAQLLQAGHTRLTAQQRPQYLAAVGTPPWEKQLARLTA